MISSLWNLKKDSFFCLVRIEHELKGKPKRALFWYYCRPWSRHTAKLSLFHPSGAQYREFIACNQKLGHFSWNISMASLPWNLDRVQWGQSLMAIPQPSVFPRTPHSSLCSTDSEGFPTAGTQSAARPSRLEGQAWEHFQPWGRQLAHQDSQLDAPLVEQFQDQFSTVFQMYPWKWSQFLIILTHLPYPTVASFVSFPHILNASWDQFPNEQLALQFLRSNT